jgi:hypothetical protein
MDPRIGLIDRLKLRLRGYVYLEDRIKPDWRTPLPFYLFRCPIHGYVEGYPRGYDDTLICPVCEEMLRKEREEKAYVDALLMDAANEAIREEKTYHHTVGVSA